MKALFLLILLLPFAAAAEDYGDKGRCTVQMQLTGSVGPATLDYFERGMQTVRDADCSSVYLEINTPGGNLETTRKIVEMIMNSPVPFLCFVTPSGGHAGSAGAIILESCHVNGAMEATNIGAATPISSMGEDIYKDLRKKLIQDTQSWMESLAKARGRNSKLAGEMVEQATAVDARRAYEEKLIDFIGFRSEDFLKFCAGKEVTVGTKVEKVFVADKDRFLFHQPDLRFQILDLVTDPQWSYLMFMGSLGLLYFEITHPGMVVPGIVGGIGLVVSLISFHKLDVFWGGVALIFLGILFLVAELFVTSFGILGVGGAISFILGSIFLFDFEKTGVHLPITLIVTISLVLFGAMFGLSYVALKTYRLPKNKGGGHATLIGSTGVVMELEGDTSSGTGRRGWVQVAGENWKFESSTPLTVGAPIVIENVQGLIVQVKPSK